VVWDSGFANGLTENLSPSGAMISVEDEPPVEAGQEVTLSVQLPGQGRKFELGARVRWVSEMLPNTLGIEFDDGLPIDAVGVLEAIAAA
jgi:Tfp pilus assembly protein PilZ